MKAAASKSTTTPQGQQMATTIDLLNQALEGGDSARELARKIGLKDNALNLQRHRGKLSPLAAGALAMHMGKDPARWMALAAVEDEPPSPQRQQLLARITRELNS